MDNLGEFKQSMKEISTSCDNIQNVLDCMVNMDDKDIQILIVSETNLIRENLIKQMEFFESIKGLLEQILNYQK